MAVSLHSCLLRRDERGRGCSGADQLPARQTPGKRTQCHSAVLTITCRHSGAATHAQEGTQRHFAVHTSTIVCALEGEGRPLRSGRSPARCRPVAVADNRTLHPSRSLCHRHAPCAGDPQLGSHRRQSLHRDRLCRHAASPRRRRHRRPRRAAAADLPARTSAADRRTKCQESRRLQEQGVLKPERVVLLRRA